jgi:hypothetical protein
MAFQYLSGSINLFNLIFTEILKVSPSLISKYTNVQDQVLNLILIPHVILFLFIYAFSIGIVGRITGGHKGFSTLVGVISYIYIVWNGWYGTFLIPLLNAWFMIALVFGLILFLVTVVVHPARGPALTNLGKEVGKMAGKKIGESINKDKKVELLYREKEHEEEEIRHFQEILRQDAGNSGAASSLSAHEDKLHQISEEIRKIEG